MGKKLFVTNESSATDPIGLQRKGYNMAGITTSLTTHDVASICNVALRVAAQWLDSGQLRGYRKPGSNAWRIRLAQLLGFMRQYSLPFDALMPCPAPRVLIADNDSEITDMLQDLLSQKTAYVVQVARNGFETGLIADEFAPNVILLDLHLGDLPGPEVCELLRLNPKLQFTQVVAMSGQLTAAEGTALLRERHGFDGYLSKPFHLQQVIRAVEDAVCGQLRSAGAVTRHKTLRTSMARLRRQPAV